MRVLGIDPGYAILGWGVLDVEGNRFRVVAYDSILTDKDTPMPRRLQELHEGLKEIIEKYNLVDKCNVYLSPVYGKISLEMMVEFMKKYKLNGVNMQLQMHKIIWAPDKRGV